MIEIDVATNEELDRHVLLSDLQKEWGDPDRSVLDDRRGVLPEFPEHVFALAVREYLVRAAAGAGVTFAHVAVPLLSIASGIIGSSRRVQASRSFIQPTCLWAAVVGFSGTGKTPGMAVSIR